MVEILSPSNSASELIEKRELCLASSCQQFWIVDPVKRLIEVTLANRMTHLYRGSERIAIGRVSYSVDEILGK